MSQVNHLTLTKINLPSVLLRFYSISDRIAFFFAVGPKKAVQLSTVQCQVFVTSHKSGSKRSYTKRSNIQDCYKRIEVWALEDLTLVDGRDPDVVMNPI